MIENNKMFNENRFLLLTPKNLKDIKDFMPSTNVMQKLALFFQNFSDSTRLKIITCLAISDMCVNDLSLSLGINQTTISHQLKLLKDQNIVSCLRNGKVITYSLINPSINEIMLTAVNEI